MTCEERQRRLVWYKRFSQLLEFLSSKPTISEIMFEVFDMLDDNKAFGSSRVAESACRSLTQVLKKNGLNAER